MVHLLVDGGPSNSVAQGEQPCHQDHDVTGVPLAVNMVLESESDGDEEEADGLTDPENGL